jgi:hypothetical protein
MSGGGMLALARDAWWAASAPSSFFRALQLDAQPRVGRALLAAVIAVLLALAVLSLAFVRATASDGWLLVWLVASAVGLPYLAMVLLLGGLVMVRPGNLDVRAWEIAAWAWTPAGALALSLAPAAYVAPLPAALVGLVAFPFWHVVLVVNGVSAFAPSRRLAATSIYLVAVFLIPWLLTAVSYAVMSGMRP